MTADRLSISSLSSILLLLTLCLSATTAAAQSSYINQEEVERILNFEQSDLDQIPEVHYDYYVLDSSRNNRVLARANFYNKLGEGDVELGRERAQVVELINRRLLRNLELGDTLVVPTEFDVDFRAYSPFPRYYPGAREFDKLFIIDKSVQAWVAYEYGQLARWGIVNTGDPGEYPTPNGRFNFNWKEEYRVSTLSPPDELWEMFWVFNFHDARGIHIHQYPMPTGGPTSRGCVRLVDADAQWIYEWADAWTTSTGTTNVGSRQGRIIEQGTTVLVTGEDPEGDPQPFEFKGRYPVLERVELPEHPYDVEPGTTQQEQFDQQRVARN